MIESSIPQKVTRNNLYPTQLYWLTDTFTRQKILNHSGHLPLQFLTNPIVFKKAESNNAQRDSQEPNAVILSYESVHMWQHMRLCHI